MKNFVQTENKYGQKIWVDETGHIGQAIINKGIYDPQAIHFIEHILQALNEPVCLDIGAHVGNHALVMSRLSKKVYCFDPEAENVASLNKSKLANNIQNIEIFPYGLSDQDEELIFYKNGLGGCSTFSAELSGTNYETQTLVCKRGDKLLQQNKINMIDFVKIDIEGFEAKALYGLKNTIEETRPIIMMEWNNAVTKEQFQKYNLFNTIFKDYFICSILNNHHKHYWGETLFGKIKRFFYRKVFKKRHALSTFNPLNNYANILLIPTEKSWIRQLKV